MKKPRFSSKISGLFKIGLLGLALNFISVSLQAQCNDISPLNCPDIVKTIPFELNFDGTEGGITDATTNQTGFTMVKSHSGNRLPEDGPASDPSLNGYEPSLLQINAGQLELTTSRGLALLGNADGNNNQINSLGVGLFAQNQKFVIETNLNGINTGTGFAQAGLWYGIDEDNYVKLVIVNNNRAELLVEQGGNTFAALQQSINLGDIANADVRLRMVLDNTLPSPVVRAFVRIDKQVERYVGEIAHNFANGTNFGGGVNNVSFAGIFGSYRDGATFQANFENFKVQPFGNCYRISTEPCASIPVSLPFELNFTGAEGGLVDANGNTTGFTMIQDHSEARMAEDLPANTDVIGYLPDRIQTNANNLELTATRGIAFQSPALSANSNNQVNTLGVGIDADSREFSIETRLLAINTGTGFAQTGLWYGLDEDNYVKLVVVNNNTIELRKEDLAESDQVLNRLAVTGLTLANRNVRLRLEVNNKGLGKLIRAYYQVGAQDEVFVGELLHTFDKGVTLYDGATTGISFAGIFATYRNGSPYTAVFDYFNISDFLTFTPDRLNFTVEEGTSISSQIAALSASSGNPTISLAKDPLPSNWLNLPTSPAIGDLSFEIDATGLTAGTTLQSIVTASATGYSAAELEVNINVIPKQSSFDPNLLHFTVFENGAIISKSVNLNSSAGTVPVTLSASAGATWLVLPTNSSTGSIDIAVDPSGLTAGSVLNGTVTASIAGFSDVTLDVEVLVIGAPTELRFNFQNETANTPSGWNRDFGEAFGTRNGANQGDGLTYGWKLLSNASLLDATAWGRDRPNPPADDILKTLMHLQPNGDEYLWELELPNGPYEVEVAVGDGGGFTNSSHSINIEGQSIINGFVPSPNEFNTANVNVLVEDGVLSLEALGGNNSKINSLIVSPLDGSLDFDTTQINLVTFQGQDLPPFQVELTASNGNPAFSLNKLEVSPNAGVDPTWLTIPGGPVLGSQNLDVASATLAPGTYVATLTATAPGYLDGILTIQVTVLALTDQFQVNFQDEATVPPAGWVKDYGQAFGNRTDINQGQGFVYGWVDTSIDQNPVNITRNGRNRSTGQTGNNKLLATLMHMQFDDLGRPNGDAIEGKWEFLLPNGSYEVEVNVGDWEVETTNITQHYLNVEGLPYIIDFDPDNVTLFQNVLDTVTVEDGRLTIDANGGTNTKINFVSFTKVDFPALSFNPKSIVLDVLIGEAIPTQIVNLSASTGVPTGLQFSKVQVADWLTLPAAALGDLDFNFDMSGLEEGVYQTTVIASAPGYVEAPINITVNLLEINWGLSINFQNDNISCPPITNYPFVNPPDGYLPDFGYAYADRGNGQTYGWIDLSGNPADNACQNMRFRNENDVEVRQNTLAHMQHPNAAARPPRNWEIELPNGTYFVNIGVGDPSFSDAIHSVNAEGVVVVDQFDQANLPGDSRSFVSKVEVTDGKLTIEADAITGVNTKINYVRIGVEEVLVNERKATLPVLAGGTNREILRIEVEKTVATDVQNVTTFSFDMGTNTSNPLDVDQAQIFYTGSDPNLSFIQQVGTPVLNPGAVFQVEDINQELLSGFNYFWLVYDVDPNATENNTVGATCTAVTVGVNDFAPVPDVGNRLVTYTDSLPENVLEFANIGDYAEVGAEIEIPENFTMEAWMFPQQNTPTARWILGEVGGAHLEQVGDEVHFYVFAEGILQGPARAKVLLNEWNHIAATYDGSFLRIYINGFEGTLASLLSGNTNVANLELDNVFTFGASNPGEAPNPMLLDEVKLWDRVLTLSELREGQHLSITGTEANLVNYWQFNRMQSATESLELVGENYVNINLSVNRPIGLEPVGRGFSHTENIMTGDGLTPTIFGASNLEITFNTDNPEGDVVVTYLTNQPFGDDPAPTRSQSPGYWVVNNYGDNNIDAVTMKFNMPDGTVLAPNPDEYFLHKRGSREFGAWEEMMDGLSEVTVSISGTNGDNFVQFAGGNASTGLKSFSQFIVTSDQSALPITLLDFSGQRIDSERVMLSWEVANQERGIQYELQVSQDAISFNQVLTLDATGDRLRNYTYVHGNNHASFYRLKILDGARESFSPIIFIEGESGSADLNIYPNPVQDEIHLRIDPALKEVNFYLQLFDSQGRFIQEFNGNTEEIGNQMNAFLSQLSTGMYYLRGRSAFGNFTHKMIKQ